MGKVMLDWPSTEKRLTRLESIKFGDLQRRQPPITREDTDQPDSTTWSDCGRATTIDNLQRWPLATCNSCGWAATATIDDFTIVVAKLIGVCVFDLFFEYSVYVYLIYFLNMFIFDYFI